MSKNCTIAVTGSTGHLGRVLISDLFRRGYQLRCQYRAQVPDELKQKAAWIQGDIRSQQQVMEFVKGMDVLIHCASMISVGDRDQDLVYKVNVEAVKTLVEACSTHKTRLIYISSSTATKDPEIGEELKENSPYRDDRQFYYAWTKAMAEKIIREAIADHRIQGFIFRPTALVGPPDYGPSRFGKVIWDMHLGKVKLIPDGGYNLLDIRDFSSAVVNSIERGKNGAIYLCGGTYVELKKLARLANPKNRVYALSPERLSSVLPMVEGLKNFIPSLKALNKQSLVTLKNAPRSVDNSRAERDLGYQSRTIEESVKDLLHWMKKKNLTEK